MCVLVQGFWTLNWFGKTLLRKGSLPQVASYGGRMGGEWKGAVVEWFLNQTESQVNLNLWHRGSCGGERVFPCSLQPVSALASCAQVTWLRSQKNAMLCFWEGAQLQSLWADAFLECKGNVMIYCGEHISRHLLLSAYRQACCPAGIRLISCALCSAVVSSIKVPVSTLHLNYQLICI